MESSPDFFLMQIFLKHADIIPVENLQEITCPYQTGAIQSMNQRFQVTSFFKYVAMKTLRCNEKHTRRNKGKRYWTFEDKPADNRGLFSNLHLFIVFLFIFTGS
jgi:hypothetical protein